MVVPPNWDSWGKIRVLRDGFDVEAINKGWSLDIEEIDETMNGQTNGTDDDREAPKVSGGAMSSFEETIRDPSLDALQATNAETNGHKLEVSSLDTQSFLATQLEVLEKIRQGGDSSGMDSSRLVSGRKSSQAGIEGSDEVRVDEGRVNEHIGPVQFNMGGIQVDADDMLQRLKVCYLVLFASESWLITICRTVKHTKPRNRNRQVLQVQGPKMKPCPPSLQVS